jgi:DNA-binding MurR/RpiR family transcriptional regulator
MSRKAPPAAEGGDSTFAAGLLKAIDAASSHFTKTDRLIAAYLTDKLATLPFETADRVAARTGVSAVSVGRFCRKLGYESFRDLKEQLRGTVQGVPWLAGEKLDEFIRSAQEDHRLRASFDAEVGAIVDIYRQAAQPAWDAMLTAIVNADQVLVAGLQAERGLASLLAYQLQYIRPSVHVLDLGSGHFSELLDNASRQSMLILIDTIRYSALGEQLCQDASESGITVVVISDQSCHWARAYAQHQVTVDSNSAMFWASIVPFACAINLIVNGVVAKIGISAVHRVETVSRRYRRFVGQFTSR